MGDNMKRLRYARVLFLALACLLLAGSAATADSLSIDLLAPYQTGVPGDVVVFDATVTNNPDATVYLNGDFTYVDSPLILDDSPYFNDYPLTLAPGEPYTGVLFNVDIPLGTPAGLYTGYFQITGGTDSSSEDVLGTADFDVATMAPEPSSLLLILTGIAGLTATRRYRQRR